MSIDNVVTPNGQMMYDNFHFSEAVKSGGFLFCSGIIGMGEGGKVPADAGEEFDNAWSGVARLLDACGLDFSDIVECTTYHVGLHEHMAGFMAVRDRHLAEPWPAWTAIGISELAMPGARVEIKVVAKLRA